MSRFRKLALGLGWGGASTIAMTGFQLAFMAVMARLLEPADFGLVAIANISLRFLSYFSQMGIGPALIQKPCLEDGDLAAAITVSLGISFAFFIVAVLSAPLAEVFFAVPKLTVVIQALAFNFIVTGVSTIQTGLLRRNSRFRAMAIIDIASYVFGYGIVGLILASAGAGVWALVGATTTQAILTLGLSYASTRHKMDLRHTPAQRSHFLRYGGKYSIIGFLEFLSSNIDAVLIGKTMGASPAGIYNRALLLANLPVQQPVNILTRVLFPILSSMAQERDKQSIGFQLSILTAGAYALAVGVGVSVAASDIVMVLLGPKWIEVVPVLKILALSVAQIYISHICSVTFDALGHLSIKLKIQSIMVVTLILLLFILRHHGLRGIALAIVVNETIRMFVFIYFVRKPLNIRFVEYFFIGLSICIFGVICGGSMLAFNTVMPHRIPLPLRLGLEALVGLLAFILAAICVRGIVTRLTSVRTIASRSERISGLLGLGITGEKR